MTRHDVTGKHNITNTIGKSSTGNKSLNNCKKYIHGTPVPVQFTQDSTLIYATLQKHVNSKVYYMYYDN